jgi:hypothetical protein
MKLDPGMHIGMHLVSFGKSGVTGDEGADKELQFVDIAQDLDPSPEGPKANLASKGKPQIINLLELFNYVCFDCAFTFQELN